MQNYNELSEQIKAMSDAVEAAYDTVLGGKKA